MTLHVEIMTLFHYLEALERWAHAQSLYTSQAAVGLLSIQELT